MYMYAHYIMPLQNIKRLTEKKYRAESGLFIVEGEKNIKELLTSDFDIEGILGTSRFLNSIHTLIKTYDERMQTRIELKEAQEDAIIKAGTFVTNAFGIAVVRQKEVISSLLILEEAQSNIVLMLDDVRDPGNLGTIIRVADWFGVTHIVASPSTVDFYNPKVINATMGSFTRISVSYMPLDTFLKESHLQSIPVMATVMEGVSTHEAVFHKNGIILMGSESHGIAKELQNYATTLLTIPRFGNAESLNVSVATGIVLDSLRR